MQGHEADLLNLWVQQAFQVLDEVHEGVYVHPKQRVLVPDKLGLDFAELSRLLLHRDALFHKTFNHVRVLGVLDLGVDLRHSSVVFAQLFGAVEADDGHHMREGLLHEQTQVGQQLGLVELREVGDNLEQRALYPDRGVREVGKQSYKELGQAVRGTGFGDEASLERGGQEEEAGLQELDLNRRLVRE